LLVALERSVGGLDPLQPVQNEVIVHFPEVRALDLGKSCRVADREMNALKPDGKLAILMGDYSDREAGYVPLVYHSKRLAYATGFRQHRTDIIRFSHGNSSSKKVYRSSFIPGFHDVCMIFERAR
jgi:hypothetical protein